MPTFIDESGDAGPGDGSSAHFRLGAVWFESYDLVQDFTDNIATLRRNLGLSPHFEFHFAHLHAQRKMAFFEAIAEHRFNFVVCSHEKNTFDRKSLTKDLIREATIGGLVKHLGDWYLAAEACKEGTAGLGERVVYDECDDPAYARLLKAQFRSLSSGRGANKKLIGDVNPRKSRVDACLQLADMVCGAVGRHLDGQSDCYNLFKNKAIAIVRVTGNANRPGNP